MKVWLVLICLMPLALRAQAPADQDAFRAAALQEVDGFRAAQGRPPVQLDDALNQLSQDWARQLAGDGRIYHRSLSSMKALLGERGWSSLNENLYRSSGPATAAAVVDAWEHSAGHRRNLLADIDRMGVSIVLRADGGFTAVFNGAAPIVLPVQPVQPVQPPLGLPGVSDGTSMSPFSRSGP